MSVLMTEMDTGYKLSLEDRENMIKRIMAALEESN